MYKSNYFQWININLLKKMPFSVPEKLTGNPCISKETCGDCITADPECAWCSQEVINNKFFILFF